MLTSWPALPLNRSLPFWPGIVKAIESGVPSTAMSWTMSGGTVETCTVTDPVLNVSGFRKMW